MQDASPHIPVLLQPILTRCAPISGVWLDGTLGAGGYARGLLHAGADRLIGVDHDPMALDMARDWGAEFGDRLTLVQGNFAQLDTYAGDAIDGVVLDLGVSSMQLDLPNRGFSFSRDGPLDMRMSQSGVSARDIVNTASEQTLADILFHYGEERASRRIARAILRVRAEAPIERTAHLAQIVAGCLPRPKPGQSHPATRSFQGLRIAVNAEFDALIDGLEAAERALKPGGALAVVSFHSLEDRVVKRFLAQRAGQGGGGNRFAPEVPQTQARFKLIEKKGIAADEPELATNPRARSARLRLARRTDAPADAADRTTLGLPRISEV